MASKLTEIVNFGSSAWPINKYCDVRSYPANAIVVHEPDDTYATGQPSSKARPSVRGVACPPQWLPVLLTTASPSLSPPPSPPPSPLPSTLIAAEEEASGDPPGLSNGTGTLPGCPSGYYDSTNGNANFWACGCSSNPEYSSKPYGTRNNCAGGCFTGGTCACACQLDKPPSCSAQNLRDLYTCTGARTDHPNPLGHYRNQDTIPAGQGNMQAVVTEVQVNFTDTAFDGGDTDVTYLFDVFGCMWDSSFVPRPVEYEQCYSEKIGTKNCPKISKQPGCNGPLQIRSEVKGEESKSNTGRFVDGKNSDGSDYSKFELNPKSGDPSKGAVSNIFEFTWCPVQDVFHATVYKQGHLDGRYKGCPYIFRNQTHNVVWLQSEKALLQAEIDQLKAEKTGTVKVVFV